jgi:hypothetical protein
VTEFAFIGNQQALLFPLLTGLECLTLCPEELTRLYEIQLTDLDVFLSIILEPVMGPVGVAKEAKSSLQEVRTEVGGSRYGREIVVEVVDL